MIRPLDESPHRPFLQALAIAFVSAASAMVIQQIGEGIRDRLARRCDRCGKQEAPKGPPP